MAAAGPIRPYAWRGEGSYPMDLVLEDDAETFKVGVPLFLDSSGFVQEVSASFGATELVYGISAENGHNLATGGTGEQFSTGEQVEGMTSGVITPPGGPINKNFGRVQIYKVRGDTEFSISIEDGQTYSQALVIPGTRYELARQSNGQWSVDTTDTGTGADHVVEILGQDPGYSGRVICIFTSTKRAVN